MKSASSPLTAPVTCWKQLGALSMIPGISDLLGVWVGAGEAALLELGPAPGAAGDGDHQGEREQERDHHTFSVGEPGATSSLWPLSDSASGVMIAADATSVPSGSTIISTARACSG